MGKVKNNHVTKIMILLFITIIILISLVGIYVKKTYQYENILPDYKLGMEFTGSRNTQKQVDKSENQVAYDTEGNVVEDYEEGQEGITVVSEKVNKDEVLTEENFKKAKEIMQKRIKQLEIKEYEIRLDTQTGNIVLELPENNQTDAILSGIYPAGKFEIVDTETGEVLLSKDQIEDSTVMYEPTTTGTQVYLAIQFNKEGTKKLEEISKTYISTQDEEGNTVENIPVFKGIQKNLELIYEKDVGCLIKKGEEKNIIQNVHIERNAYAPIEQGQKFGEITYSLNGNTLSTVNIVAKDKIDKISTLNMITFVYNNWFNLCR